MELYREHISSCGTDKFSPCRLFCHVMILACHFVLCFSMPPKRFSPREDLSEKFTAVSLVNTVRPPPMKRSRPLSPGNFEAQDLFRLKIRNDGGKTLSTACSPKSEWLTISTNSSSGCTTGFAILKAGCCFPKRSKSSLN